MQHPIKEKEKHFYIMKEARRKDVDRSFGVIQAKYYIVKYPRRISEEGVMKYIMYTCIVLHNMMVVDLETLDNIVSDMEESVGIRVGEEDLLH